MESLFLLRNADDSNGHLPMEEEQRSYNKKNYHVFILTTILGSRNIKDIA